VSLLIMTDSARATRTTATRVRHAMIAICAAGAGVCWAGRREQLQRRRRGMGHPVLNNVAL
jgi:hypothetical protein